MASYNVYVNNVKVKSYPFKIQAAVYCFMSGYVYTGRRLYFLDPRVEIRKVEKDD